MYENMKSSNIISLDIETYDPRLVKRKDFRGPGVFKSKPLDFLNENGFIIGVSLRDEKGNHGYYNLGHYDCTPELRQKNLAYLKETLEAEHTVIGANLLYDLDWLENWANIKVNGKLVDVQVAESLLDENQGKYNLDFMGKKYFGEQGGKAKDLPVQFCLDNNLKMNNNDPRPWLYKMPYYIVEDYAIQDIELPFKIWEIQKPKLIDEDLLELAELEFDLLRVLLLMRKTGTRIDTVQRDLNAEELDKRIDMLYESVKNEVKTDFNFRSTKHLAFIFDMLDIPYPLTDKGNPSITRDTLMFLAKGQLEDHNGDKIVDERLIKIGEQLADLRRADKVLKTFIRGTLVDFLTDGDLIHASFYPTRRDDFGTRSGRFSSANPNLQQVPSTGVDPYYGKLARQPFVPFDNSWWGKLDYSQIEYRFMAHFARGKGADEVRAQYNANARTDYHQYIQDLTGLKRRYAKNLNFGVAYGMGAKHMAEFFQWDLEYCYDILHTYHSHAPFIKSTIRAVEGVSKRRGYIRTFLKRRSRLLDPNKAYTMFCRLTQGSAADLMKKGMYDVYKAGIFNVLPPHITVHDEIDVSVPKTKEGIEAFIEAKRIMETCVQLKVPIIADMELGPNWAEVEDIKGDLKFCEVELNKKLKEEQTKKTDS